MNIVKADCHCHTHHSDGALSPIALLDEAKKKNLFGLSITDHDTVAAYESALPYAKTLQIELVPGIEISTEYEKASIHVLGYAFDLHYPGLHAFCQRLQNERQHRNEEIIRRLTAAKMPITLEEIAARFPNRSIGRPHMAALLLEKGYVSSLKQAFERYLGEKGRCYAPGFQSSVEEAIALIHQAGGFAVLAHPHCIPARLISHLSSLPFDGIEVFYGYLSVAQEKPWFALAQKKGWMMTGGSDFHNDTHHSPLGTSWTPVETFELFLQRYQSH